MYQSKFKSLTKRQQQILVFLLRGKTPKTISLDLNISIHTVREHTRDIYLKFNVSSRNELMAMFLNRIARRLDRKLATINCNSK